MRLGSCTVRLALSITLAALPLSPRGAKAAEDPDGDALALEPAVTGAGLELLLEGAPALVGRGPVERRDGLIVFRGLDGRLASIREERVIEVRPLPVETASAEPTGPEAAGASGPVVGDALAHRFANADLPAVAVLPPSAVTAAGMGGPEKEDAAAPDEGKGEADLELTNARSEAWWRARARALRSRREAAEKRWRIESGLLACLKDDVELSDAECRPRVNRVNRINRVNQLGPSFVSRSERQLARGVQSAQRELAEIDAAWQTLLEEARRARVPLRWLQEDGP